MNKKGDANEQILQTVIFLAVLFIFTLLMAYYVQQQRDGVIVWEDFYAKETANVINSLNAGDEFVLDVQKATEVAKKNKVDFDKIFSFDSDKNEICVKLSAGRKSCYSYFNKIAFNSEMKYGMPGNLLVIKAGKSDSNG